MPLSPSPWQARPSEYTPGSTVLYDAGGRLVCVLVNAADASADDYALLARAPELLAAVRWLRDLQRNGPRMAAMLAELEIDRLLAELPAPAPEGLPAAKE